MRKKYSSKVMKLNKSKNIKKKYLKGKNKQKRNK